ncbi:MAG: hypothetical protein ACRCT0_14260, partial [Plesiomonas shigelloides]
MKRDQILQLVAMAEQMPVNIEDPMSGQNRRIEITVLTEQAAAQIAQLFGRANAKPMPPYMAPQPNAAPRPAANAVNGICTVTAPAANGMVPSANSVPSKSVAPSAAQPATLPPAANRARSAASAGNHAGNNNAGLPPLLTDQAGNLVRIGIDPILPGMATLTPDHAKPVGQRSAPAAPLKALPVKPHTAPVAPAPEVLLPARVEHG